MTLIARRLRRPAPINTRLTALARRAARDGLTSGSIDAEQLRVLVSTPGEPGKALPTGR